MHRGAREIRFRKHRTCGLHRHFRSLSRLTAARSCALRTRFDAPLDREVESTESPCNCILNIVSRGEKSEESKIMRPRLHA